MRQAVAPHSTQQKALGAQCRAHALAPIGAAQLTPPHARALARIYRPRQLGPVQVLEDLLGLEEGLEVVDLPQPHH